ncbi:hypothetical protein LEP1GSC072_0171 [Leptospira noguchii str. Bonito]|nr:hypothetical protein LEP1GSC072_1223 [Leptospira noguchii str. Bonito]EMI72080.1 hypothetical protein LEP1GSC072_0171 [Leptospira noguchii str. Bonito]
MYSIYGARTVRKVMKLCEIQGKQEKRFRIATQILIMGIGLLQT